MLMLVGLVGVDVLMRMLWPIFDTVEDCKFVL